MSIQTHNPSISKTSKVGLFLGLLLGLIVSLGPIFNAHTIVLSLEQTEWVENFQQQQKQLIAFCRALKTPHVSSSLLIVVKQLSPNQLKDQHQQATLLALFQSIQRQMKQPVIKDFLPKKKLPLHSEEYHS